jgi:glucan phosphoethanolaminetransferase (alkaline phosphatase superfamily)
MGFLIFPDEETKYHVVSQIVAHDALIYILIISLIYFSYLKFVNRFLSYTLRILSIFLFIIYNIDIYLLKNFVTHININDVNKYLFYVPKYISQQYTINFFQIILFTIICIIIVFFIKKHLILTKKLHISFISSLIILISINSYSEDKYVHSWTYKNFIEYNIDLLSQSKDYTKKYKNSISIDDKIICENKTKENKNIIVLMVESLASYQSKYFSGIRDWTPNFDKIAQSNINIKNFYSNGFITEDAEISILTGLFPIYAPTMKTKIGSTAFQGFYSIENSLPNHLHKNGYTTEFITSSDLSFSNTGKWADSLGFDYIEGSSHPYYKNKKRYHFDVPEDKYLFQRVLKRVEKKKSNDKYFIFVKTVSSHIPFLNPENNHYSEEETIKYVDKQIGKFYNKLKDTSFFKNGILIIVGDHHPIIPLKKEQIDKYGMFSSGIRVPIVISFGENKNKTLNNTFQQVDIYNSIKNFTSTKQCTSLWNGDFLLDKPVSPKFLIYRRGDKRGTVSVFNQKGELYNVRLNGDDTKVTNQSISDSTKTIINKINYERIKRQENHL